jgi:hypothetical protein
LLPPFCVLETCPWGAVATRPPRVRRVSVAAAAAARPLLPRSLSFAAAWSAHVCALTRPRVWRPVVRLGWRQRCGRCAISTHARQMYEGQPCCNMFAHVTGTFTNTQVGPCKTVSGDTYVMGGPSASSIETGPQPWVPKMVLDLRGKNVTRIVRCRSLPLIFRTKKRPLLLFPVLIFFASLGT